MGFGKHGWGIIAYTFVCMMSNGLIHTNGINVLIPLLESERGWSSAMLLGLDTAAGIVGVFFSFLIGRMIIRWGCRRVATVSLLAGGVVVILFGQVNSVAGFFVCMTLLFCATDAFGQMVPFTLNASWFSRKKGRALGIATAGYPVCAVIAVPLLLWSFATLGFQGSFLAIGCFYIALGIVTAFVVRDRPEDVGAHLDNDPTCIIVENAPTGSAPTANALIHDKNMWAIALSMGFVWASTIGLVSQLVPSLMNVGFSQNDATRVLQATSLCGIAGSFLFGWIDDRFGTRRASITLCVVYVFVFAVMATIVENAIALALVVVMGGVGSGAVCNLLPSFVATMYGREGFASANALVSPIASIVRCMNFSILGAGLAIGGSYRVGYAIFGVLCFVALLLVIRTKPTEKALSRVERQAIEIE